MSWTDERIATLKKMWEGGSTASQIADELGGVSRNAVIGKAHRLGLKSRPSPVKANEKKKPAVKAKPAAPKPVAKKPVKPAAKPAPTAQSLRRSLRRRSRQRPMPQSRRSPCPTSLRTCPRSFRSVRAVFSVRARATSRPLSRRRRRADWYRPNLVRRSPTRRACWICRTRYVAGLWVTLASPISISAGSP